MSTSIKTKMTFGKTTFSVYSGSRLHKLCTELKLEFPDLKMGHKREIWWHWVAHVLVCIFTLGLNRIYISSFTTTGKNRVDWSDGHWERLTGLLRDGRMRKTSPSREEHDRVWECLMHEREHLRQFKKYGVVLMVLMWAIPPILFCYGRAIVIEKPGYIQSLRAKFETDRAWAGHPDYRTWWVSQFTGPNYGWMWMIKSQVEHWFDNELARLRKEAT